MVRQWQPIKRQLIGAVPLAWWRWLVGPRPEGGSGSSEHLDVLVEDKVVVFLKGTPEQPQCGFSNAVVQILRLHGVRDYAAYNVLDDPQLRQGQGWLRAGLGGDLPWPLCGAEGLSGGRSGYGFPHRIRASRVGARSS